MCGDRAASGFFPSTERHIRFSTVASALLLPLLLLLAVPAIAHVCPTTSCANSLAAHIGGCQQRALNDFLEEKRSKFPRFYFIGAPQTTSPVRPRSMALTGTHAGDDDLLEVLGQAQSPTVIQSQLKKLFAGIHRCVPRSPAEASQARSVTFSEDKKTILSMKSSDGEASPALARRGAHIMRL